MQAAQREMQALQQIEADMKREEKEFHTRMDALRAKLESASKTHTAAQTRKALLEKERARIEKELVRSFGRPRLHLPGLLTSPRCYPHTPSWALSRRRRQMWNLRSSQISSRKSPRRL